MSNIEAIKFQPVNWASAGAEIIGVRRKVFVVERRFDKKMLFDSFDLESFHLVASNSGEQIIGCGRLTRDGRLGRIAVLIDQRGKGIGTMILGRLIKIAEQNQIKNISLNTERDLVNFYQQQSFAETGPVYMKQGVPYQHMIKHLG